jgi:hypothetical protein
VVSPSPLLPLRPRRPPLPPPLLAYVLSSPSCSSSSFSSARQVYLCDWSVVVRLSA